MPIRYICDCQPFPYMLTRYIYESYIRLNHDVAGLVVIVTVY